MSMSKKSKITRQYRDFTYKKETLTDGTPFLRPVVAQGDRNRFLLHLSRMVDYRYRKQCKDNNTLPKFQVSCPDEVGGFRGNSYINKKGVEKVFEDVIMTTAVERGLPVTGEPNLRYHITDYRMIDDPHSDSTFDSLTEELASFGPFVVGITPKSDFPPVPGKVYKGLGKPDVQDPSDHALTVIGYSEVVVTEKVKGKKNKKNKSKTNYLG